MPDPLLIERQYQTLRQSLGLLAGRRTKILRILEFVEPLMNDSDQSFLAAYVRELQPRFTGLLTGTDLTGTPMHVVDRMHRFLDVIRSRHGDLADQDACIRANHHLQTYRDEIQRWRERSPDAHTDGRRETPSAGAVWIPLVEREPLLPGIKPEFGSLQHLKVEVSIATRRKEKDELVVANFGDQTGVGQLILGPALDAAKHLLKVFTRIEVKHPLSVRCWFTDANVVVGESLEAGLAAALFTQLLRVYRHREEYSLRDCLAITGKVDSSGRLIPVDEEGLRLKVEACNYSPMKYLIVPKEQEEICKSFVANGNLQVTGVSDLSELFYNRRLTDSVRVPAAKQAMRVIWKHRRPVALSVFAALVLAVAKLWYGPVDQEPTNLKFEGEMLLVQNKRGETIEEIRGEATMASYLDRPVREFASLLDVDGDGIKEAVWIQPGSRDGSGSWVVCCKTVREDSLRWKVSLRRKLTFPGQEKMGEDFRGRMLLAGDFDADGSPEIFVVAYHDHFPSYVARLEASTGSIRSTYVHAGHLNYSAVADLDDDGVQEILLSGMNNAFNEACLIVLDPRFADGHGPVTERYRVDEFPPGLERAYVLIPRTIVGKAILKERYSKGGNIDIHRESREFRLGVSDQDEDPEYLATFYIMFGFDLRPKSITTNNQYDVAAARLFSEGRITRFPDKQYFDGFKKSLRYWDGEGWRGEPVPTGKYTQELDEPQFLLPGGIRVP